ncbi:MAG: hypothetical protein CL661_05600 [Bacteroidetes bacterium]|nr:hypothetical protein [Bacteroidota bacterium]
MSIFKDITTYLLLITTILIISSFQITTDDESHYEKWRKVDSLTKSGQPKSAIKIIDHIYKTSKENDNTPQIIKSLIYRISLQSSYEEDHLLKSIAVFENELSNAAVPEKQILQSLIAELYFAYYNANRWKINKRQALSEDDNEDINTWDAIRINKIIKKYYKASLEDETVLAEIDLDKYEIILLQGDSSNFTLWPSLFDMLANRALQYFISTDAEFTQIVSTFKTSYNGYFQLSAEFVSLYINPNESSQTEVLILFQRLLALQIKQNNTEALVDLDLKRLKYVYENSLQDENSEATYLRSLTLLADKYIKHSVYASIAFQLANQYFITGKSYVPGFNENNRYDLVKADSICKVAISEFPNVNGSNNCRNLVEIINQISFGFDIPVAEMPDKPILSLVQFKNINKLYFKIVIGDPKADANKNNRKKQILKELEQKALMSWEQKLPITKDHRMHRVEVQIPELTPGYYVIFASNDSLFRTTENIKFKPIWITNISYITSANKSGGYTDMYTLNRETGISIGKVNITIYKRQYDNRSRTYAVKEASKLTSDKNGYAKIESITGNNFGTYLFMFEKDGNQLFSENYINFYRPKENSKPKIKTYLFTDRAVYRPGQTIYFKGIVIEELGNDVKLLTDYTTDLKFINASRKNIQTTSFTTNNNGSFNGEFIIPTGGLNGQMTIKSKTGRVSFIVENYKLPTFEVNFDSIVSQIKLNETITITGKAMSYSGSSVDGAAVRYRVTRKAVFPRPYFRDKHLYPINLGREVEITHGDLITSSNGTFELQFDAIPDYRIPRKAEPVFTYKINVEVTDITNEVQTAQTTVNIGQKAVVLTFDLPEVVDRDNIQNPGIEAANLNGSLISFDVSLSLYKLTPPSRLMNKRQWAHPDFYIIPETEFKKNFPHAIYKNEDDRSMWKKEKISHQQITIKGKSQFPENYLNELAPGEYMIVASGEDNDGETVENTHFFTLFSSLGKKLPGNMIYWSALSSKEAEPGETIKLVVGSAARKSRILYEIVNDNNIVERKWINLNRGQKTISIPVTEAYRGNFSVNLTMVRFNSLYSNNLKVIVPYSNKKLDIKLSTFRNHLIPGINEEWSVTISGNKGQKFAAELLAGMYDASLDIFRPNSWQMKLYYDKRQSSKWESNQFVSSLSSTLVAKKLKYFKVHRIEYPAVNWFGYQFIGNRYGIQSTMDGVFLETSAVRKSVNQDTFGEVDGVKIEKDNESIAEEENEEQVIIPLRKNFSETAFFYANLKTDSLGNAVFKFTTPDALTEWKVMMLAYTNDLKVGTLERKIKSQKELMIIPNVPRFVRQGDTLIFSAKVINFTENEILAKTNIEFFDAITMEPLSIFIANNHKTISQNIDPKQSISVSWGISIPENINMLGFRITASTGTFIDGEERMFPVLTNRMLVTNTMPMNVSVLSTANFSFKGLSEFNKKESSIRNYRYTLEFTSNPAWYAIQALPYLSSPGSKNNMSLFNNYFANALSSYIVNSNPKIKAVFESWKYKTPDAFLSNLEKNQDLKNIIITSTPWVLDAEDETEQKRRISILFDVNRMANEKENLTRKLLEAQLSSGAWPWFKGMREDRHTTQTIVLGMAKLNHKGVIDLDSDKKRFHMVKKAVSWLDAKIANDYVTLKKKSGKSLNNYQIRSSQTQYLYIRALLVDIMPIPEKSKEAFQYYIDQTKKYWLKQSNYLQGMMAITLNKFGYRNDSEAIIRSLKERSLYNKEMGMYWRQKAGWNWYQAPIETQTMMIETFSELENNPTIIEQLKIWLLKQKQTQHWNTSSATAEAVYTLLMFGNNALDNNNLVDITVGNQIIDINGNSDITAESGTGYFSTSWSGSEITPELSQISITNPNNHIAWGAAYWQYFEDLDKIKTNISPLSINKKLFIEKLTPSGPILIPVDTNLELNPGDKIISHLIISTDRNMEYIHLNDMRATAFEPVSPLSGYTYNGGLWYYKNITDVSTDFFIRYLNKGTYVLEYPLYVTQIGDFTVGIATIQSMYAPEFSAHSSGLRVKVSEQ